MAKELKYGSEARKALEAGTNCIGFTTGALLKSEAFTLVTDEVISPFFWEP